MNDNYAFLLRNMKRNTKALDTGVLNIIGTQVGAYGALHHRDFDKLEEFNTALDRYVVKDGYVTGSWSDKLLKTDIDTMVGRFKDFVQPQVAQLVADNRDTKQLLTRHMKGPEADAILAGGINKWMPSDASADKGRNAKKGFQGVQDEFMNGKFA